MSENKLYAFFSGRRREALTFSFCVLLATVIWTVNALNKTYTVRIRIPVDYALPDPTGIELLNKQSVTVELKGKGFQLMRAQAALSSQIIRPGSLPHRDADTIVSVHEYIVSKLEEHSPNTEVIRINPEQLPIVSKGLYQLRLPLESNWRPQITDSRQLPSGPALLIPDSITLYSFQQFSNTTQRIELAPLDEKSTATNGLIRMKPLIHDSLHAFPAAEMLWLYYPTEQCTEIVLQVAVRCDHHQSAIPSSVKLTCKVPISRVKDTKSGSFILHTKAEKTPDGYSLVEVLHKPSWCHHLKLQPEAVQILGRN